MTLDDFGRFDQPAQQILASLASGPRIPLSIHRELGARCGRSPGPGTLFGAIARLELHALIEVVPAPAAPRAYRLTALGAETLQAHLEAVARALPSLVQATTRGRAR